MRRRSVARVPAASSRRPPAAGVLVLAYLGGAVPWSNVAARLTRGVDLRDVGTGTVSGTSLYRVSGFGPLAAAGVLDVAKGALGPLLAGASRPALGSVAGGVAIVGHDWSPFLGGHGGRGVSPALGALLALEWRGAVVLGAGLGFGRLARHTALGCFVADVALVPLLARLGGRRGMIAAAAIVGPMLVKRVLGNASPSCWDRRVVLSRLVLDRDPS